MPAVVDPVTGLELFELSHRWGMYMAILFDLARTAPQRATDQIFSAGIPRDRDREAIKNSSPASAFCAGQVMYVDGGFTAG
jgi:hypothetical protein